MARSAPSVPRSLVLATDLDVLPADRVVVRRDGYLAVSSPRNPGHYWGNLLVFDDPPASGERPRWEALFDREFADEPRVGHRTFAWDRTDGSTGATHTEFTDHGYEVDESVGLVATPDEVLPHPRASQDAAVRALDPSPGADRRLWDGVLELEVATREPQHGEESYRGFKRAWLEGMREHFAAGRGSWYVALDPTTGELTASCGVVVTGGRGRFQSVLTAPEHRRRGICSRLVVDAARDAVERFDARRLVIVADLHYHALGLYESLGFARTEHVVGVMRPPDAAAPAPRAP